MMPQDYIQEYYRLQNESFCDHVKTVVDALEKILLELILAEQANAMRTNLKNQVIWMNLQDKQ